jgi:D-aminoacyl-tRNA deacylase
MRAVVQRVSQAQVEVADAQSAKRVVGQIGLGLLVLVGVGQGDGEAEADYIAQKIAGLRIFPDARGKMNLDVSQAAGAILLVSQFTLYGDVRKGRRPAFDAAAPPDVADRLYRYLGEKLRAAGLQVETGQFQAHMEVTLVNDGPVTILLDSARQF